MSQFKCKFVSHFKQSKVTIASTMNYIQKYFYDLGVLNRSKEIFFDFFSFLASRHEFLLHRFVHTPDRLKCCSTTEIWNYFLPNRLHLLCFKFFLLIVSKNWATWCSKRRKIGNREKKTKCNSLSKGTQLVDLTKAITVNSINSWNCLFPSMN